MNQNVGRIFTVYFIISAMLLAVCSPGTVSEAAKKNAKNASQNAKNASIKQKKLTVTVGKPKKITIKNKKKNRKYTYTSNKKRIATVTKKGVIQGKRQGKAVITVKEVTAAKKRKKREWSERFR